MTGDSLTSSPTPADAAIPRKQSTITTPDPKPVKTTYRRGDVWYVITDHDNPSVGTELWADRPAVIVSNNVSSNRAGFVQAIFLTTSTNKRTGPTHVPLGRVIDDRETMALCEQIHTIDISRLTRRKGRVPKPAMSQIDAAIMFSLSIRHDPDEFSLFRKWEQHIKTHGINLAHEIEALAARTNDERVTALRKALAATAAQRDAYRVLYESADTIPYLFNQVDTAFTRDTSNTSEDNIPTNSDTESDDANAS